MIPSLFQRPLPQPRPAWARRVAHTAVGRTVLPLVGAVTSLLEVSGLPNFLLQHYSRNKID